MPTRKFTFITLLLVVLIAGMSQGLTIPLMTILLERMGVSSFANGMNAATLYVGILLVSPWMEIPLRKFGYKTTIWMGLSLVTLSTLFIPLWQGFTIWMVLRMVLGIGDVCLHYASQMWVTVLAGDKNQGRSLSLYGFAYGAGFSIGPQGLYLLKFGISIPFFALLLFYAIAFVMVTRLPNEYPASTEPAKKSENRYRTVFRQGWLALLPSFLYGFTEATLNTNFPIYALHIGISLQWIATILSGFVVGSLFLQIPLAVLSDRLDRKIVMMLAAGVGAIAFVITPFLHSPYWLLLLFIVSGATVGSFYSLGLAFITDVLPKQMVPTAGILAGMNFSVASILAPNLNGWMLQYTWPGTFFIVMAAFTVLFTCGGFFFRRQTSYSGKISQQLE